MNVLRVILATLVIFATGVCTGYFFGRESASPSTTTSGPSVLASTNAPADWNRRREEMRASLQREINATDEQMAKVDEILAQSRRRSREIWQTIKVPMEVEVERVKDEIRGVLDEEQAAKYEDIMKRRGRFGPGGNHDKSARPQASSESKSCGLTGRPRPQCFL